LTRFRQVARCFFSAFSRAAAYPQVALTLNGTVPRPCQIFLMKQGGCSSHTVQSARPKSGARNGPPHDRSDSGAAWTQPCAGTKPKNDFELRATDGSPCRFKQIQFSDHTGWSVLWLGGWQFPRYVNAMT